MSILLILGIIIVVLVFSRLGLACVILGFALLWALNTLFHLHLDYNFINWLAAVIVLLVAGAFSNAKG